MGKTKNFFSWRFFEAFLDSLSKRELYLFFLFSFLFFSSLSFLLNYYYFKYTKVLPKEGGKIVLGEIGFPSFLNPLYSISFEADDAVVNLLFSGLMKYENGQLIPDLVENYEILEEGRVYEFTLKNNIFWSDGTEITTDDVLFTIRSIQTPEVKSPLRPVWLGVEVEKISEKTFRFKLKNSSIGFLENCTLKIIPKHSWEKIPASAFPLSFLNLEPLSSGPYLLKEIFRDKEGKIVSLNLEKNPKYFGKKPYISLISFKFFEDEKKLLEAARKKEIDGFSFPGFITINGFKKINFKMPRYFGVFFNLEKKVFQKEVREALNYATNKKEILLKVFKNEGKVVDSPILSDILRNESLEKKFVFHLEKAEEILRNNGFSDFDGDGKKEKILKKEPSFQFKNDLILGSKGKEVEELQKCLAKNPEIYPEGEINGYFGKKTKEAVIRFQEKYKEEILKPLGLEKGTGEVKGKTKEKLNTVCFEKKEERIELKFNLVTTDQPLMIEIANILKEQWQKIGAEVEIKIEKPEVIKGDIIPNRKYDSILFGQMFGQIIDPFPFWHSSQKSEVGLNLSNYENKELDKILERIRTTTEENQRKEDLKKFQEIIMQDIPAIFLVSPDYLYFVSKKIIGIKEETIFTISQKYDNIKNWYVKTKREFY